jgi:hypothetical protein
MNIVELSYALKVEPMRLLEPIFGHPFAWLVPDSEP